MKSGETMAFNELVELPSLPSVKHMAGNPLIGLIKSAIGADYFCIGDLTSSPDLVEQRTCLLSDAPLEYLEAYFDGSMVDDDPLRKLALSSDRSVDDEMAFRVEQPSQALLALKARFGIANRTMTPIFRGSEKIGFLIVTRQKRLTPAEMAFLEWMGPLVHQTFVDPVFENRKNRYRKLTSGEITCLALASKGLNSQQISVAANFKFETVNSYLKDATKKLGAANRLEAVVIALTAGII